MEIDNEQIGTLKLVDQLDYDLHSQVNFDWMYIEKENARAIVRLVLHLLTTPSWCREIPF